MRALTIILICFATFGYSQNVEIVNADELQYIYKKNNDTAYVINFWATWCKPCIDELPEFLKLEKELKNQFVKFLFVSLDDVKYKDTRVVPFVKKNEMYNVFILDDKDPNEWIPKISEEWTGSIPATLFSKNGNSSFHEKKLNYDQLKEIIKKELN